MANARQTWASAPSRSAEGGAARAWVRACAPLARRRHTTKHRIDVHLVRPIAAVVEMPGFGQQRHHRRVVGHQAGAQRQDLVFGRIDQVAVDAPLKQRLHRLFTGGDLGGEADGGGAMGRDTAEQERQAGCASIHD